jgi:hypothetical protein
MDEIRVRIECSDHRHLDVKILSSSTVTQLKKSIEDGLEIAANEQVLIFAGTALDDSDTLESLGLITSLFVLSSVVCETGDRLHLYRNRRRVNCCCCENVPPIF